MESWFNFQSNVQGAQYTYNLTLKRVHVAGVTVEKR
jgi:hypothetical protein